MGWFRVFLLGTSFVFPRFFISGVEIVKGSKSEYDREERDVILQTILSKVLVEYIFY